MIRSADEVLAARSSSGMAPSQPATSRLLSPTSRRTDYFGRGRLCSRATSSTPSLLLHATD